MIETEKTLLSEAGASVDALELYRWAVQDPETHATVLDVMHRRVHPGRSARSLREDFAGTCAESVAWVALRPGRTAIAVDLDAKTLAWARRRAERLLGPMADRVMFIEGDSLAVGVEAARADIISVLNFSILYLREAAMLERYLAHARRCLSDDGILVMNVFGGPEAMRVGSTRHRIEPRPRLPSERGVPAFDYRWEVKRFDPATGEIQCAIHFEIDDRAARREVRDAFEYRWRLWSVEALMNACRTAGFTRVEMWRHTYNPGNGVFLGPVDPGVVRGLNQWTAYVVAGV